MATVMRMSKKSVCFASLVLWLPLLAVSVHFFPSTSRGTQLPGRLARCVAEPTRDLGHTTVQRELGVIFPIRNNGMRRLVLNEVDRQCQCGDRARRTIVIPPGATDEVTVILDTRFAAGPIEATAAFTTNDPRRPTLMLTARAWVDTADAAGHSSAGIGNERSVLIRE